MVDWGRTHFDEDLNLGGRRGEYIAQRTIAVAIYFRGENVEKRPAPFGASSYHTEPNNATLKFESTPKNMDQTCQTQLFFQYFDNSRNLKNLGEQITKCFFS